METEDLFPNLEEDLIIGSATTIQQIVDVLAKRGCSDLTLSMNLSAFGDAPCAGGGYCDIYRGALHNGSIVAVKSLIFYNRLEAQADSDMQEMSKRAARELYRWSKLRHHNVLPLMGLAIFRGKLSMVSEWMEHGDLMSYLRLKPDANRNSLCMDICEGLCYIHANGMVHGDLKAANVMISANGSAMIADFGNAQLKDLTLKFSNTTKSGLSVRWAAPELLLEDGGPQLSNEADVYAFGMTMLEVMTGKVPYEGTSDNRILILVAVEKRFPPRPKDLSNDLWELLNSCWDREPSKRPQVTTIKSRLQILFWPPTDMRSIGGAGEGGTISSSALHASSATIWGERVGEIKPGTPLGIGVSSLRKRSTKMWGERVEEVIPSTALGTGVSPNVPVTITDEPERQRVTFKWVKGQLIGQGSFGRVYHALNATTGEMIVVKQIELPKTDSDRAGSRHITVVDALKSKNDMLRELDHPHIVEYLGFEETTDTFSIFLEYVPGSSVGSVLRRFGKFEDDVVRSFSHQIIDGLAYLHKSGILHLNLKGDNILVDTSGVCKISDFGFSKQSGHVDDNHEETAMPGMVFWLAPEALHDEQAYNAKIDIWSVGCVVLEMQAGRRPWSEEDEVTVRNKVGGLRQAPPVPDDVHLAPLADDFRKKCFAVNPAERPTAVELLTHPWPQVPPGWAFKGFN